MKGIERLHMNLRPLTNEQYGTVRMFFLSSAVWFVIGTFIGLIDAIHLAAPELLGNISWLVFGRTRPMHTNMVIFGFVGSALLGAALAFLRHPFILTGLRGQATSFIAYMGALFLGSVVAALGITAALGVWAMALLGAALLWASALLGKRVGQMFRAG